MLNDLLSRMTSELSLQELQDLLPSSSVDQSQGVQTSSLRVRTARSGGSRKVRSEEGHSSREVPLVNDSESSGGRELGPVRGSSQPVKVLSKELIRGGSGVHEGVGKGDGRVVHRRTSFESILREWEGRKGRRKLGKKEGRREGGNELKRTLVFLRMRRSALLCL